MTFLPLKSSLLPEKLLQLVTTDKMARVLMSFTLIMYKISVRAFFNSNP